MNRQRDERTTHWFRAGHTRLAKSMEMLLVSVHSRKAEYGGYADTPLRGVTESPSHSPLADLEKTVRRLNTSGTITSAVPADERMPIIWLE